MFEKNKLLEQVAMFAKYSFLKQLCIGKSVLDTACGDGFGSYQIAQWGAKSVCGADISVEQITKARQKYNRPNLKYEVVNVEQISKFFQDEKFEIIITVETIEHITDAKKYLNSLNQLLSKDGELIVICPNDELTCSDSILSNPYHITKYNYEKFISAVSSILGKPEQVFYGVPCYGVINVLNDSFAEDAKMQSLPLSNNNNFHEQSLYFTAVWGQGHLNLGGCIQPLFMKEWIELISFDYVENLKKDRLIFELQQRSLLADALEVESTLLKKQIDLLNDRKLFLNQQRSTMRRYIYFVAKKLLPSKAKLFIRQRILKK